MIFLGGAARALLFKLPGTRLLLCPCALLFSFHTGTHADSRPSLASTWFDLYHHQDAWGRVSPGRLTMPDPLLHFSLRLYASACSAF